MTIADIISEFGAYYINSGQNVSRIFQQLYTQFQSEKVFSPFFTDDTIYRASEARQGRILQPFQKAWTPTGAATFLPVAIQMFKAKADVQETPDDLEGTWLGFLASNSLDRREWPFVRWWVEQMLIPKMKSDLEEAEIGKGIFGAPVPGTAGDAGTTMNGYIVAITNQIAGGRITPIATGPPPNTGDADADNLAWVKAVEGFADQIDQRYQMAQMNLAMSQSNAKKFRRGYRVKYGRDLDFNGVKNIVDDTNLTITGLPGMNGLDMIWCTPLENAILLRKKTENMGKFDIDRVDRQVKLWTDFWIGCGFIIPEAVFVNDQNNNYGQ